MLELVPCQLHDLQERHDSLFGSDEHSLSVGLLPEHRIGLQGHSEGHVARHEHKHIVCERACVLLCIFLACQLLDMLADASYVSVESGGLFLFGRGVHVFHECGERDL